MERILKIAERLGADSCEIFYSSSRSHSFSTVGDVIKTKEFDSDSGFGVRILKDDRIGFSYFTDLKKAEEAVKTAVSISKFSSEIKGFEFSCDKNFPNVEGTYDKKIGDLSADDAKNFIYALASGVKYHAEPIESDLDFGVSNIRILNSCGLDVSDKCTKISCSVQAGYENSSAHETGSSCSLDLDFRAIGERAGLLAKQMYKPKKIKNQKTNVIFHQAALYDLFSTMLDPAVNGSKTRRGLSFFCGKENTQVAGDFLNVYDDPLYPRAIGSFGFDAEGSKAFKKPLIENGILKNFLYDIKNAAIANTKTTGNCGRGDYSSPVFVSPSNMVVGSGNVNDLIRECKSGIYFYSALGWHTANSLAGDFSVSVDVGFEIEDGEITEGISGVIAGNFFEMLNKISGIEKKQEAFLDLISPKIGFYDMNAVGD